MLPGNTTSLPSVKPLMGFHDTDQRSAKDSKRESHSVDFFCTRTSEVTKVQQVTGI